MKVELFTETTIKGPCAIKKGTYAAIVEVQTTKGPARKGTAHTEDWTTFHRSALLAVLEGLETLNRSCEVTIYTPDPFLVNMVRGGNIEKWKREEWRRPQNNNLKNKELWQQLWEQTQKHELRFVFARENKYSKELIERMIECEKSHKCTNGAEEQTTDTPAASVGTA